MINDEHSLESALDKQIDQLLRDIAKEIPPQGFGLTPPTIESASKYVKKIWGQIHDSICKKIKELKLLEDDSKQRRLEIALLIFATLCESLSPQLATFVSAAIVLEGFHLLCYQNSLP